MRPEQLDALLHELDPERRVAVRSLIGSKEFAPPQVASFAMDDLTVSSSLAMGSNGTLYQA